VKYPLSYYALLVEPARVEASLERLRASGRIPHVPTLWQIALGVIRMQHRLLFRSETVGTSALPIRATWRARALRFRPLRFPFLLRARAVAPLDMSGLSSEPARVLSHLLGAHHDGNQFAYDLEMLSLTPGGQRWLERARDGARAVLEEDTPYSAWLRDLCVHEGYHASLLAATTRALEGDFGLSDAERVNPDISFSAYLDWCARQPATPEETWRALLAGRYHPERGLASA
jgi:hypothetical protein